MRIVIGGVGQLYQGDLDLARHVVERLKDADLGPQVVVEDFDYGAVAVSQRLEDLRPDALLLVGAAPGAREPGAVTRRRIGPEAPPTDQVMASVEGAVTGYVTLDMLLDVARAFGSAPRRMVVFEVQPEETGSSTELSRRVAAALPRVEEWVRREARLTPLFMLADELREALVESHLEPSGSVRRVEAILAGIEHLEGGGGWGEIFALRNHLRLDISQGDLSEGMSHSDWALWWAVVEELDRLQGEDAAGAAR